MQLNFVWRWTLATLAVAVILTFAVAAYIEREHRAALETDEEVATVSSVRAAFVGPLDALAQGARGTDVAAELASAERTARTDTAIADVRVYDADGRAIYPRTAPPARDPVAYVWAHDRELRVDTGPLIDVYAPVHVPHRAGMYVIAVDFSSVEVHRAARERRPAFRLAGIVIAIICVALAILAAGTARDFRRSALEAQASFVSALSFMAQAIDMRDPYTAGHSKRVAAYSRALAIELQLPPRDVATIESGALLHDIGKIGVPDAVLFKPGLLDPAERRTMSAHPALGARLIGDISLMRDIVPCVLHHHERVDGAGYPSGLRGSGIPFGARVIAVADAYDAMTTDRPYRAATSSAEALAELERTAGTQFDAKVVAVFAQLVRSGRLPAPPVPSGVTDERRS